MGENNYAVKQRSQTDDMVNNLQKVRKHKLVSEHTYFTEELDYMIERLQAEEFRLIVTGQFSSGKSTFLNALLGEDLLKHGVSETTATITEIYQDRKQNGGFLLEVHFADGKVKKTTNPKDIAEYTTTGSQSYHVVQEIEKVEIRSDILKQDANVCFVDTPGLNGNADHHREKTIEQIKNGHACIYLLPLRGLAASDIEFIKLIGEYQRNILFVQNFKDAMIAQEGMTVEETIQEQERIIREKILPEIPDLQYRITAVSAQKALCAKAAFFTVYNGETLDTKLRKRLYEESGWEEVLQILQEWVVNNEKKKTQIKDTVRTVLAVLERLQQFFSCTLEEQKEMSAEEHNRQNYQQQLQLLVEQKEEKWRRLENYIIGESADIRRRCRKELEEKIAETADEISQSMEACPDIESFETYTEQKIAGEIYRKLSDLQDVLHQHLGMQLENLFSNAVLRVANIRLQDTKQKEEFKFQPKKKEIRQGFEKEEEKTQQLKREIEGDKAKQRQNQEKKEAIQQEKSKIEIEKEKTRKEQKKNLQQKEKKERALGSEPQPEVKTRKETYEKSWGGLGILDRLIGKKVKTRTVEYLDHSKQTEWQRQKWMIEDNYRTKEEKLYDKENALLRQKEELEGQLQRLEKTSQEKAKDIQRKEELLRTWQERLKIEKEKAKQEYLREARRNMKKQVEQYLEIQKDLLADHDEALLEKSKERITEWIRKVFEENYEKQKNDLEKLVENMAISGKEKEIEEVLQLIKQTKEEMERGL